MIKTDVRAIVAALESHCQTYISGFFKFSGDTIDPPISKKKMAA